MNDESPEARRRRAKERRCASLAAARTDPGARARHSEAMKAMWRDPVEREKRSVAIRAAKARAREALMKVDKVPPKQHRKPGTAADLAQCPRDPLEAAIFGDGT